VRPLWLPRGIHDGRKRWEDASKTETIAARIGNNSASNNDASFRRMATRSDNLQKIICAALHAVATFLIAKNS
jgi:hypothetical protein